MARLIKAVQSAGLAIGRVIIEAGKIVVETAETLRQDSGNDLDRELAEFAERHHDQD